MKHSKNIWCKVNGQSQNMHSGWYILDRIKFTYITKYLSKRVYREFDKLFKVCRRYLKLYISELECRFCSLICFFVPMYTNMAWNPAEVNYFTLIGNMITVQNIQNVGMFSIHTMKRLWTGKWIWKCCKMCLFKHLNMLKSKFNCLCFGWNIVASSGSLAENTSLLR